ncbi:AAA family ATPase [Bradyrhizobium pachyrhizi]|uniref:AAA family ATPase n=1 Tax=Bradyrhizobium pachyrhizi TaxID=280333 RepID=UPI003D36AD4C
MFKSEVRDSTINGLLEKARERNYGQYLARLVLKKVRGFNDEPISFDFPVTAIIGPNGGGKTTVLGAAGIIYKDVAPRTFFSKSGKYDAGMQDWSIEYELVDRKFSKDHIRRTASFKSLKWNRDAMDSSISRQWEIWPERSLRSAREGGSRPSRAKPPHQASSPYERSDTRENHVTR